jgi:hypothetical protein
MKDIKYKLAALVLGFCLISSSCSDWLEMKPINQTYGDGFWISEAAAEQTLAGAYALLRGTMLSSGGQSFLLYGEMLGTLYLQRGYTDEIKFQDGSFWNPDMEVFQWAKYYKIIAQCNVILLKAAALDKGLFKNGEAGKQKILGEAYFLRAFTYFYLVKVWGDVPLVTEATMTVSDVISGDGFVKNVPRDTEAKVLEQCITDLKKAESSLSYGTFGSSEWAVRANKGAAQALMAHVYLWMHKPVEAELAADAVIKNGGYSLVNYSDSAAVSKLFTGKSSEGIFELNIKYDQSESYTDGIAHKTLVHPWLRNLLENDGTWVVQRAYVSTLYEANDLRIKRFFGLWTSARPIILKYASVVYEDAGKFFNPHGNSNIILFRLSDMILLRAEALAKSSRFTEARTLVNTIRTRAGATPYTGTDTDLPYFIFQERERELIGEGHTYFDRIRGDQWTNISWMNPTRKSLKGYYWPLPATYITNNPLLVQNPYWAMKTY